MCALCSRARGRRTRSQERMGRGGIQKGKKVFVQGKHGEVLENPVARMGGKLDERRKLLMKRRLKSLGKKITPAPIMEDQKFAGRKKTLPGKGVSPGKEHLRLKKRERQQKEREVGEATM